jgi:hypothetical protein
MWPQISILLFNNQEISIEVVDVLHLLITLQEFFGCIQSRNAGLAKVVSLTTRTAFECNARIFVSQVLQPSLDNFLWHQI